MYFLRIDYVPSCGVVSSVPRLGFFFKLSFLYILLVVCWLLYRSFVK